MQKRSVAFISCVGTVDYTRSQLLMETILAMGIAVIAIMPGSASRTTLADLILHVPLPTPTRHFWYNRGWRNTVFALGQRFRISWLLLGKLVQIRPSVCVCSEPDAWFLAVLGKLFFGCKVVADLREVYEDRALAFPRFFRPGIRLMLRALMYGLSVLTDTIIHVSEERQAIYAYLDKSGVIIGNYPKLAAFAAAEGNQSVIDRSSEHIIAIHVGALRPSYASGQLLEAMDMATAACPDIRFVVLGGVQGSVGHANLLESLCSRGFLQFHEQVPYEEVLRWLAVSQIGISLVLPVDVAHQLAAPQKLYEYLAAGLPVVGADVSTIRRVLVGYECGIVVEPTSPSAIATAIIQIAMNTDLRLKMSQNARNAAESTFNWEIQTAKLEEIFRTLE